MFSLHEKNLLGLLGYHPPQPLSGVAEGQEEGLSRSEEELGIGIPHRTVPPLEELHRPYPVLELPSPSMPYYVTYVLHRGTLIPWQ